MTDPDPDLDQRLRAYAERWRDRLPEPDVSAATTREPRSRWLLPLIAAAVLALVVGITYASRGGQRADPAPSNTARGVVPWAALPATHPVIPVRTVTPPAPAASTARPCRDDDLLLGAATRDGAAAGTAYVSFAVRLVGRRPCRIQGFPSVVPLSHGAPIAVTVERGGTSDLGSSKEVLVQHGRPAAITVAWAVSHHCPVVTNDELLLRLPGLTRDRVAPGFGQSQCTPGEGSSTMRIGAIHSETAPTPHKVSRYDELVVSGDLDVAVDPGARVHFIVTLTSPTDLSLTPCPDYRIVTSAGEHTWGLNCAEVPYRDAAGLPYLPAGTPVRFAMEAESGGQSTPKFLWVLDGTRTPHSLSGTLTVRGQALAGSIEGTMVRVGGPSPGVSLKVTDGTVRAVGGGVDRTASTDEGAAFTLAGLPPGDYRVTGSTPQWNDGAWGCTTEGTVHVASGRVSQVQVICSMR